LIYYFFVIFGQETRDLIGRVADPCPAQISTPPAEETY
jgi:hypothetical protein